MRGFSWMLLFLAGSEMQHYPLPLSATITIGQAKNVADAGSADAELDCGKYHLTPGAVRKQFASYHHVDGAEIHDKYSLLPCEIDGTVVVNGKTYQWTSNEGNLMSITYPDGKWKDLGGKPSGDLRW